jgi:hypothetical protein
MARSQRMKRGSILLNARVDDVIAYAALMSNPKQLGSLVPKHLHGKRNRLRCLFVIFQALLNHENPWELANRSYIVRGKLAYKPNRKVHHVTITRTSRKKVPKSTRTIPRAIKVGSSRRRKPTPRGNRAR